MGEKTLLIEVEGRGTPGEDGTPTPGWLCPDGGFSSHKGEAASFVFRTSPTGMDERRITLAKIRLAGEMDNDPDSHGAWLNRQLAEEKARNAAYGLLEKAIGSFTPEPEETPEAFVKRKNAALQKAWDTCQDPAFVKMRSRFYGILDEMAEIDLWARWEVLQVAVPPGWEKLHEHPAYTRLRGVFAQAWVALSREESQGKSQPSGS